MSANAKIAFLAVFAGLALLLPRELFAGMVYVPMWQRMPCGSGECACYTFEQTKKLVQVDLDLQLAGEKLSVCVKSNEDLSNAYLLAEQANDKMKALLDDAERRLVEKVQAIVQLSEENQKLQARHIGNYVLWIAAGAALCLGGGFVVGWIIGSS